MKTLITGATGFLGSTLARRLLQDRVHIRALRRKSSNLELLGDEAEQIEWVTADVTNKDSLRDIFEGVSRVYHCAAYIGFDGKSSRRKLMEINVGGTANMVDAAVEAGIERFVLTSSIASLSRPARSKELLTEEAEWRKSPNNSDYGESKYLSELEVQRGIAEGLDAVIVNPSLIMGVGKAGENTMLLVEKIRRKAIPFLPVGGTNVVDVLDVVDGHIRAMERGISGERYLLTGENLPWADVIRILAEALDVTPPKRFASRKLMIGLATVIEFGAKITGSRALITREAARMSSSTTYYDNSKAIEKLECSFRPFAQTAERIATNMLQRG